MHVTRYASIRYLKEVLLSIHPCQLTRRSVHFILNDLVGMVCNIYLLYCSFFLQEAVDFVYISTRKDSLNNTR